MRAIASFIIKPVSWAESCGDLRAVRRRVFIEEQGVPEALEWDTADEAALHVLALDENEMPIGTGRLGPGGRIGRVAVLQSWRGHGVGRAVVEALLEIAREARHRRVYLHAQTYALEFYARLGFSPVGEQFEEAGIAHRSMELTFGRQAGGR